MKNARVAWVDYAKAIGIILVVYGHVARGLCSAGIPFDASLFSVSDSIVYSFHMPLFFFLSGMFFVGSLTKRGAKGLLINKIDTIIYPYLIWSILQGSVEVFLASFTNGDVTFAEVFSLLWQPRAQFWFLYALFLVFVVAILLFKATKMKFVVPIFILSILLYVFQNQIPQIMNVGFVLNYLVFFVLGILFRAIPDKVIEAKSFLFITTAGFLMVQYLFHFVLDLRYTDVGWLSLLVALTSIVFVVSLSGQLSMRPSKALVLIGSSSMSIYLMHVLAASGARIFLTKIFGINNLFLHLLIGSLVGILVPLIAEAAMKRFNLTFLLSWPVTAVLAKWYHKLFMKHSALA